RRRRPDLDADVCDRQGRAALNQEFQQVGLGGVQGDDGDDGAVALRVAHGRAVVRRQAFYAVLATDRGPRSTNQSRIVDELLQGADKRLSFEEVHQSRGGQQGAQV